MSDLQNRMMSYLADNGIATCTPLKTTSGDITCSVNFSGGPNKGMSQYSHVDSYQDLMF